MIREMSKRSSWLCRFSVDVQNLLLFWFLWSSGFLWVPGVIFLGLFSRFFNGFIWVFQIVFGLIFWVSCSELLRFLGWFCWVFGMLFLGWRRKREMGRDVGEAERMPKPWLSKGFLQLAWSLPWGKEYVGMYMWVLRCSEARIVCCHQLCASQAWAGSRYVQNWLLWGIL